VTALLPDLEIQQAIFVRASADETITQAFGAGVYDEPPEDAPRPYLIVGDAPFTTTRDEAHGTFGWETVITVSIWVEERGFKLAHELAQRLVELFHRQFMELPSFHVVDVRLEMSQLLRDPSNPRLRRSQVRLRIRTEQT
jgi:hypothetical protein